MSDPLVPAGLMSLEDARGAMLEAVAGFEPRRITLPLESALDHGLAADLRAMRDQPPFAASAMDGWAVRASDGVSPRRIIGESAAGQGFTHALGPGEAVRIFTGAPLPPGADHVVVQEVARRDGDQLRFESLGDAFVRPAGLDFARGALLIAKGQRLDGPRLALAAANGLAEVELFARPRIALIATGNELVEPGHPAGPDQIYDSVSFGLAGLVREWGGEAVRVARQADAADAIVAATRQAQQEADLVVLIGGASVGDHDHARAAVGAGRMVVEKVALRPGKPSWFARTPMGPLLGLPGNPASALVCARLFLRPLIEAMAGLIPAERAHGFSARLARPLPRNGPRAHVRRAVVTVDDQGQLLARSAVDPDSSLVTPFVLSNALIVQPAHDAEKAAGALIETHWMTDAGQMTQAGWRGADGRGEVTG